MINQNQLLKSFNYDYLWICVFSFWPSEKKCEPKFYQCKYLDQINYNLVTNKLSVTVTFPDNCSINTDTISTSFNEFSYDHKKLMYYGVFNSLDDAKKCFIETMKKWSDNMFSYEKEVQNNG